MSNTLTCQYCDARVPRTQVGVHWGHWIGSNHFTCTFQTLDGKPEPTKGPVGHYVITDSNYFSICGRMEGLIEEVLHRHRKIQAVTITAGWNGMSNHFYGSIFWTEGQ